VLRIRPCRSLLRIRTNPEAAYNVTLYIPFLFQFMFLISKQSSRQVCPQTDSIFPLPQNETPIKTNQFKCLFSYLFSLRIRRLNDSTSLKIFFPASPFYSQHLSSLKFKIPGHLWPLFCPRGFPSLPTFMNLSIHGSTVLSLDLDRFCNFLILYIVGRTPWTRDQPVARPLPTQRATQTQDKRTYRHPCLE
jgi:hypothetical protein